MQNEIPANEVRLWLIVVTMLLAGTLSLIANADTVPNTASAGLTLVPIPETACVPPRLRRGAVRVASR